MQNPNPRDTLPRIRLFFLIGSLHEFNHVDVSQKESSASRGQDGPHSEEPAGKFAGAFLYLFMYRKHLIKEKRFERELGPCTVPNLTPLGVPRVPLVPMGNWVHRVVNLIPWCVGRFVWCWAAIQRNGGNLFF